MRATQLNFTQNCRQNLDISIPCCFPATFFRPCFFSEAKKAKERFKVVVVGGGSDRWASPVSVYTQILNGYVAFVSRLAPG